MNPNLRFYSRLLLRRAPFMLLLLLLCASVGLILAVRLPTTYESTARMLVQSQEVSEELAASTVQIAALEEIELQRERLMTRANLIEIAHDHDVFEDIETLTPDDVAEAMQAATQIQVQGSDRAGPRPTLMTVTFRARSGQIAADVVNEYVTRIRAENVRLRTGQAEDTLDFFQQEVDRLAADLEIRSGRITAFQRENADALPDDQEFRLQRLSLLQERMAAAERELRALQEARARTIEVFQATGTIGPNTNLTPEEQELRQLEAELRRLETTFSDTAPQVVNLRRQIERLEAQIANQTVALAAEEEGDEDESGGAPLLAVQLADIDTRIETIEIVIADTQAELETLEQAIARTPNNAIQLQRLERDYENIQLQYDNARRALAQASIGERLEAGGRGQRITLLDPPVVPSAPASPNRPVVAGAGIFSGLVLAAGLFLLLELLNRSVRRPAEIVKSLGITPLATMPYIESARRRFARRALRASLVLIVLVGVPAALWSIDRYYLPLDLLAEQLLSRLRSV